MPGGKEKRSQRLSKARHPLPHRGKSFKLDGVETADADNMDVDINDFKIKSLRLTEL